jgi:tight adherence protein B
MIVFYTLAFVAGAALVFGVNLLLVDIERERRQKMLKQFELEQRLIQRERAEHSLSNQNLFELATGLDDRGSSQSLREKLKLFFEQSGVRVAPWQLAAIAIVTCGVGGFLAWWWTRSGLLTGLVAVASGAAPLFWVTTVRQRRLSKLQHQLPEAFDVISRMMQAGRTFPQAMQTASQDCSPPLSQEFGYCCDQQQLGMAPDAALRDLARRNGLLEIKIFVLAVSIHRQSGGNLSSLLEKLADVIRGRVRMKDMISALTSEARMQVYILTALPFLALLLLRFIRPTYAQELLDRPGLVAYCVVSLVLGWAWMRRILNFSF